MNKLKLVVCGLLLFAVAAPALAQDDARIRKLEAQLNQMQAELAALKAQQQTVVTQDNVDANCHIGIAWSDDLVTWNWPGKKKQP